MQVRRSPTISSALYDDFSEHQALSKADALVKSRKDRTFLNSGELYLASLLCGLDVVCLSSTRKPLAPSQGRPL